MPGIESLKQQQYYANPHNSFWQLIYKIFNKDMDSDYKDAVKFLKEKKIALWDVFKNCEREGSLDSNIRNAELNDIQALLEEYPGIEYVFCNGGKASDQFRRMILPKILRQVPYINLPSTSPANASIPMDVKYRMWSQIRLALSNKKLFESLLKTKIGTIAIYSNGKSLTNVCLPEAIRPSIDEYAIFSGDTISEKAKKEICEYMDGKRRSFDIPVSVEGTPFQKKIYDELLKVPYGQTISYGQLAERTGSKGASRAVGQAMRKNPVPLIIPCHRVIGSDGKTTGFMGIRDNPIQSTLLELEQSYTV